MWTALTNICLLEWKIRTSSALEMIKLFWLFFCWKILVYQKRNHINRDLLEAAVLPKNFSGWFLAVSQLPRQCWWCQATFALYLTWGPGTFQLESLGPGVLIQKFRLRDAALWDFQFLSESSHFQDDRSLRDAAVQGLEPRQDTQPPWKKGLQSLQLLGKQSCGWDPHSTAWQVKEQMIQVKLPREFRKQSYCTSDQLCLFLQQILWNPIDFKWNSALVYGRHTKLPEISESSTHNLTESFLVSLLMINSPGLV